MEAKIKAFRLKLRGPRDPSLWNELNQLQDLGGSKKVLFQNVGSLKGDLVKSANLSVR